MSPRRARGYWSGVAVLGAATLGGCRSHPARPATCAREAPASPCTSHPTATAAHVALQTSSADLAWEEFSDAPMPPESGCRRSTTRVAQDLPLAAVARRAGDGVGRPGGPVACIQPHRVVFTRSHVLNGDDSWYRNTLRAVLPFEAGSLTHVLRFNQPFLHKSPEGMPVGANDLAVFDLLTKTSRGLSYGIGANLSIPWGTQGLSENKWSIGPAGAIKYSTGGWLFAALSQNYFSVAGEKDARDVARSVFQPLIVRDLGKGYTIGFAELNFTYDWSRERWTEVPFGLSATKTTRIHGQAVKFTLTTDYNFVDDLAAPDWTFRFAISLLFP